MSDILNLLEQVITDVDILIAEPLLLPVKAKEHVVGTMNDLERRIVALKVLNQKQVTEALSEADRLQRSAMTTDEDLALCMAQFRIIRVRLVLLSSLLTLSLQLRFPVLLDRDIIVVRENWQVVWAEEFDKRNELSNAAFTLDLSKTDYQA